MPMARCSGATGRCTSRTTRCFTKNSISRPATSASARSIPSSGKLGVCVCWDQWFPEAARLTALSGAQLLFYPTAIGWHPGEKEEFGVRQHSSWETIQRSHAIANGCYVAAINRVGHEAPAGGPGIEFWGQSFVCDPSGQILAKASVHEEETLHVEIDFDTVETQRTHWPFLRDRRIESYGDIGKRLID